MSKTLRTWLQLFRAPNLFTVPGDPLVGYVLAAYGVFEQWAWFAVGASMCFYAAGLLVNDLVDLGEDRIERPWRPLPSGAADPRTVSRVAMALTALGLLLAGLIGPSALVIGLALVIAIGLYNHVTKRLPVIGALNMGLCRGLSLLLGAAAAPHGELLWGLLTTGRLNYLLVAFALVTLYIAALTHLAGYETKKGAPFVAKWLPMLVLAIGAPCFLIHVSPETNQTTLSLLALFGDGLPDRIVEATTMDLNSQRISGVLFFIALIVTIQVGALLTWDRSQEIPPQIGRLIRNLLIIQCAFCTAGIVIALAYPMAFALAGFLLIAWPISRYVSEKFYAS
jgi:4-hydroxybenzoate polyprenyltransferase